MLPTGSGQGIPTSQPQSKPLEKLHDLRPLLIAACRKKSAALRAYVEGKQLGERFKVEAARMQKRNPYKNWSKKKHSMAIDSANIRMLQTWLNCAEEVRNLSDSISRREKALAVAEDHYLKAGHALDVARIDYHIARVRGIGGALLLKEVWLVICDAEAISSKEKLAGLRKRWL